MKKLIIIPIIITMLLLLFGKEYKVQGNECPTVSARIKRAMLKMGPGYKYTYEAGILFVNKGNGQERLRY